MRALAIRRYQVPLEMVELPQPRPGRGELRVRVRAAGKVVIRIADQGALKPLLRRRQASPGSS